MAGGYFVRSVRRLDRSQPRPGEPHRNLMAAVLRAAVEDIYDAATRKHALPYVISTDRRWPFSFENLCEALGMDPDGVRRELEKELTVGPSGDIGPGVRT